MSPTKLLCPMYYQIVKYDGRDWYFKESRKIYNPKRVPVPSNFLEMDKLAYFGTSKARLVLEFRLLNGGLTGYYLADLRDKQYYYCGASLADVQTVLRKLGIGRLDPTE